MWAYRLLGPSQLEEVTVADPRPDDLAPNQVLLRTLAGGICGSDLPKFRADKGIEVRPDGGICVGRPGFPMHEVVGEVLASRHRDISVGSRVVGWAVASDALAEQVVTDGDQLAPYAAGLCAEEAVLVQSLACVLYAMDQLRVAGERVAVIGLGPMGLLFAHALRRAGAAEVIGVDPVDRSADGAFFGLDRVVRAPSGPWARGLTTADRPGVVIEAVGHQVSTLQHAIDACAVGGRIVYFGIPDDEMYPLDMERLMRKNLTLIGGVTRRRREMLLRANDYLLEHRDLFANLVTHRLPIKRVQEAFDAAVPAPGRLKIVVSME